MHLEDEDLNTAASHTDDSNGVPQNDEQIMEEDTKETVPYHVEKTKQVQILILTLWLIGQVYLSMLFNIYCY